MKVVQTAIAAYLAILGMILRRLLFLDDRPSEGMDSVCFVATAIRQQALPENTTSSTPTAEVLNPPASCADPVSFSRQLANLQQNLYRANQPSVMMQPVPVITRVN